MSYIIKNAVLTDGFSVFYDNVDIYIEGEKIAKIGDSREWNLGAMPFYDVQGRLVMPGFLNAHTHLYSALATSLPLTKQPNDFYEILTHLWWKLDKILSPGAIYFSAMLGLINCIKSGVTTVFDHHASMGVVKGSLNIIKKVFEETGLNGLLCYEISDREKNLAVQLEENLNFCEQQKNSNQIKGVLGLHANFTLSDDSLQFIAENSDTEPIHIHLAESEIDKNYCLDDGYKGCLDRLENFGLLSEKALLAHCVHLTSSDYELLQKYQPTVIHNPESNINNCVGHINRQRLTDLVLGTDGMTSNMISTIKSAYLAAKRDEEDLGFGWDFVSKAAFKNKQKILEKYFVNRGKIEEGAIADLAVLDYVPVTNINKDNLLGHFIFGIENTNAFMTIANGKVLYHDNEIKILNEFAIYNQIKGVSQKLYEKFSG